MKGVCLQEATSIRCEGIFINSCAETVVKSYHMYRTAQPKTLSSASLVAWQDTKAASLCCLSGSHVRTMQPIKNCYDKLLVTRQDP